jgi:DNA-binding transcriptional regulator YiaG
MVDHGGKRKGSGTERLARYRRNTCLVAERTRRKNLLSRAQAAKKTGVKPRRIRSWEDGDRGMEVAELIVLAEDYGEDPIEVFTEIYRPKKA